MIEISNANIPSWKTINVKSQIPESLKKLDTIAHNMWWSWNQDAKDLFAMLDEKLYAECGKNPVLLLEKLGFERLEELSKDKNVLAALDSVYSRFEKYMSVKPDANRPSVAYFCMEYGLSSVLKIYSGGLGVLAGDYLKEASDSNVDMCAVGFLYRYGYFTQALSMDGSQIANYEAQNFNTLPIERVMESNGVPMVIEVPFNDFNVQANVWRVNVGRVPLYLLDTDFEQNSEYDRPITHKLYGGDWENRLKQEILLGIGGMIMLEKLGIKKDIYHCNEGHAALCNLHRLTQYIKDGYTFEEALEIVRSSSLYTVHTPVPAGHDYFDEALFSKYMRNYPAKLNITWDELMGMGRINAKDKSERFCMSTFACNTCQEINGVSRLHGKVSKYMFAGIWKGYFAEENHVGYVTNGVHFPTWVAPEWDALYTKYFDASFHGDQSNASIWEAIYNVPNDEIWAIRKQLKSKLIDHIRQSFKENWLKNQGDPMRIVNLLDKINPNALLIGFGRRFATYKRAHLLFTDLERLAQIVNNEERPIQFLFTGKAHPHDGAGQGLIKKIMEISKMPQFLGKIIFLENYDMDLAKMLVSGVDIWMNTPTRPLEASGTSGEKALMNGVLNLSVLDGWWCEGYKPGAGWALKEQRTYQNQEHQDQLDAATIYALLENEILPLFHDNRGGKEYSDAWVKFIKNSIAQVAPHFTMKRQLDDYYSKFYNKQAKRFHHLMEDDAKAARTLASWKEQVAARWNEIEVVSIEKDENVVNGNMEVGKSYSISMVIDEKGLNDAVGVELVTLTTDNNGNDVIYSVEPMEMVKQEGNLFTFNINYSLNNAGAFKVCYRIYPKHEELPHRQDFAFVKWMA
ncbi:MAG: alpha-glucan family phosphorylase [Bacteroidaceae bacterium]|nr:alpha-glucan family phosphorylase [Bacteroidaceae bacterium]MBQ5705971.1 alpha-glucan family phosphorylase [Bacteroidaceae bacterium]